MPLRVQAGMNQKGKSNTKKRRRRAPLQACEMSALSFSAQPWSVVLDDDARMAYFEFGYAKHRRVGVDVEAGP